MEQEHQGSVVACDNISSGTMVEAELMSIRDEPAANIHN